MGKGIDYGLGQTNRDPANGIRFGCINMNALSEWAWESTEPDYGDPACPNCGGSVEDFDGEKHDNYQESPGCSDYACENCERVYDSADVYGDEPNGHTVTDKGYSAFVDGYNDMIITRSPYFTHAAYASPCFPGGCHLESPHPDGERTYCLGHDWFTGDRAPYPVFLVETGEPVPAPGPGVPDQETEDQETEDEDQETA